MYPTVKDGLDRFSSSSICQIPHFSDQSKSKALFHLTRCIHAVLIKMLTNPELSPLAVCTPDRGAEELQTFLICFISFLTICLEHSTPDHGHRFPAPLINRDNDCYTRLPLPTSPSGDLPLKLPDGKKRRPIQGCSSIPHRPVQKRVHIVDKTEK